MRRTHAQMTTDFAHITDIAELERIIHEKTIEREALANARKNLRIECPAGGCVAIPQHVLADMLADEQRRRLSEDLQVRFEAAERRSDTDWIEVMVEEQKQVVMAFGFTGSPDIIETALFALRQYALEHPEDALQIKHNRARPGHLRVGDLAPNVVVYDMDAQPLRLIPALTTTTTDSAITTDSAVTTDASVGSPAEVETANPADTPPATPEMPLHMPSVILAGSYSWPPFRGLQPVFAELCRDFSDVFAFSMVYIAEAHAMDEWPVRSGRYNADRGAVCINQPKVLVDRVAVAKDFVKDFNVQGMRVCVDDPVTDDFMTQYAPWPIRMYVIDEQGYMAFIPEQKDCSYDVSELRDVLLGWKSRRPTK